MDTRSPLYNIKQRLQLVNRITKFVGPSDPALFRNGTRFRVPARRLEQGNDMFSAGISFVGIGVAVKVCCALSCVTIVGCGTRSLFVDAFYRYPPILSMTEWQPFPAI